MLPLPILDDRMFEQLVQDAKKTVRKYAPQWTDENLHDPGVTLIELFAWLTEMQQFYLDQIEDRHYLKYLQLLGFKPQPAQPGCTELTFAGGPEEVLLPSGSKAYAGDLSFETTDALLVIPTKLEKVLTRTSANYFDHTSANYYQGISFYAFDEQPQKGNKLYLGFAGPLPVGRQLSLTLKMFDDYPVRVNPSPAGTPAVITSARISYRFYGADGGLQGKWFDLADVNDGTLQLTRDGRIDFTVPVAMQEIEVHPANDRKLYWVCLTLEEEGYELPPRIEDIRLNTVSAVQQETFSEVFPVIGNGQPDQEFIVSSFLALYGQIEVMVQEDGGGWRYWQQVECIDDAGAEARSFVKKREADGIAIVFGNGSQGGILADGQQARIVAFAPSFIKARRLGTGNGLAGQKLMLPVMPVVGSGLLLQVAVHQSGQDEYLWEDWTLVDDFDASGKADRHFILDRVTGEITFGDNVRGLTPQASAEANIYLLAYRTSSGARGNAASLQINRLEADLAERTGLTVTNLSPVVGGTDAEPLEMTKMRAGRLIHQRARAITSDDFEEIARVTPGLRIARVKAIPLYAPGLAGYPENTAPAQVTVVVVPYGQTATPVPGPGFLATVYAHLDKHRLVTTEMHVIGPQYIKVSVNASAVRMPGMQVNKEKIVAALRAFLHPLHGPDETKGWPFGHTVYMGDIYGVIKGIAGVEFIKELWLSAEGSEIEVMANGDIRIPPYSLVYSGHHEINVVDREDI